MQTESTATERATTELAIIGAGPAGLAAAEVAVSYGIDVCIIDEQPKPGGQIYRQPPQGFEVRNWLANKLYSEIRTLVNKVEGLDGIHWYFQATVLAIADSAMTQSVGESVDDSAGESVGKTTGNYRITLNNPQQTIELDAQCVLIAPGCYDMPVLMPGWNLPGVMATGGIQAFVKSQQLVPGERFLFAGTHPLQLIVADQILQAGGQVADILFAQSLSSVFKVFALKVLKSPSVLLNHGGKLLYIMTVLLRLLKRGVPIRFSRTVTRANGEEALQSVDTVAIDNAGSLGQQTQKVSCDRLGLCFSFLASSELARQVGAHYRWSAKDGGWLVNHDDWMRTNLSGLYVAGEITAVAGVDVAMLEGRLAGLGIARELNKIDVNEAVARAKKVRRELASANRFADLLKQLSYPGKELLLSLMTEESTLCKCEEVSVGAFKRCLDGNDPITNANAAKLVSRAGMGLCQGRYCNYYISSLLADKLAISEEHTGSFTARFPAKPVTIGSLLNRQQQKTGRD